MARIPDNEIERLKKEVALERLVLGFEPPRERRSLNRPGNAGGFRI